MKPRKSVDPRRVILKVVENYLDEAEFSKLKKEIYSKDYSTDYQFIKKIEEYFDFTILRTNPKDWQDIWIYNYILYDTKKSPVVSPLDRGEYIRFIGKLPKKGLIIKYRDFLIEKANNVSPSGNKNISANKKIKELGIIHKHLVKKNSAKQETAKKSD